MNEINNRELHELFNRLKENKKIAYEELYEKYSLLVYKIAFSILKDKENSEDVMQNVFVKIGKLSKDKLPTNYEASWLYTVTKNEAISLIRKNRNNENINDIIEQRQDNNIEEVLQKETYEQIISSLDDREKQIVSLKIDSQMSFKEIANLLKMPIGTVQWKYYKSLHSLKLLIGNLSLFIIASILCVNNFLFKNRKKQSNVAQEQSKENVHLESSRVDEDDKIQSSIEEDENKLNNKQEEDKSEDKNEYKDQYEAQIQQNSETIYKEDNSNVGNFVLLGITAISLCFTIFFTIIIVNHQQKNSKKHLNNKKGKGDYNE